MLRIRLHSHPVGKEEAHAVSIAGAVGMDAWEAVRRAASKRMIYAAKGREAVKHDMMNAEASKIERCDQGG